MSHLAVDAQGVSKLYRLQGGERERYTALRDVLARKLRLSRSAPRHTRELQDFWALQDLNLSVAEGETVGIIGRNGAGKSTLLKILSRITPPTRGRIKLRGRVGSLLEVGTGFHPELSGRENIFLNGAILGMSQAEIRRKFDEIVDFAGVERFLETPVKRYSSGMYVRLAFAVAAHLEPDVLVVDEVLAVGDLEFQKKCLGKMDEAVKSGGRTVLFVSHNLVALRSLCTRAVWLEQGQKKLEGPADEVVGSFIAGLSRTELRRSWSAEERAPGNDKVRLVRASVGALDEPEAGALTVADALQISFDYQLTADANPIHLSISLWNEEGVPVFNTFPDPDTVPAAQQAGRWTSSFVIPPNLLNNGTYRVQLLFVESRTNVLSVHDDVLSFEVQDRRSPTLGWHGKWIGTVRPALRWSTHLAQSAAHTAASAPRPQLQLAPAQQGMP